MVNAREASPIRETSYSYRTDVDTKRNILYGCEAIVADEAAVFAADLKDSRNAEARARTADRG